MLSACSQPSPSFDRIIQKPGTTEQKRVVFFNNYLGSGDKMEVRDPETGKYSEIFFDFDGNQEIGNIPQDGYTERVPGGFIAYYRNETVFVPQSADSFKVDITAAYRRQKLAKATQEYIEWLTAIAEQEN